MDVFSHFLNQVTMYEDPRVLRPSLDTLIQRHGKQAAKVWKKAKGNADPLQEPPYLGHRTRTAPPDVMFRHLRRPRTMNELEELVAGGGKGKGQPSGTAGGEQQESDDDDSIRVED